MIDSPQRKPGTTWVPGGNTKDAGSPQADPLAGKGNTQTSTHYPHTAGAAVNESGGKLIEGQNLRGYVHNEAGRSIGAVTDGTVAADGTRRVHKH